MPTLDSALPLPPGESGAARDIVALPASELEARWERVLEVLRGSIRREQFETWFRRIAALVLDGEQMVLAVHNAFAREWLLDYYKEELVSAAEKALGGRRTLEIRVDPERVALVARAEPLPTPPPVTPAPLSARRTPPLADVPDELRPGALLGGSDVTSILSV